MIAKWKVKAFVQKFISFLPQKNKINFLFQRYITKGVVLTDQHFEQKLIHASDHIKYFKKYGNTINSKSIVELGTGWYPIIPISLFLSGSAKVISFDIYSCLTQKNKFLTIEKFLQWHHQGKLQNYLKDIKNERLMVLQEILEKRNGITDERVNELLNFDPKIQDARTTNILANSIDFICSNNTFEHIYPEVLNVILTEFNRILKKGGVMSHFIDMSDHFAHLDKSITIYNFLQYSEKQWQLIDNNIQPQNRWRLSDYINLYKKSGIDIIEKSVIKGKKEDLHQVKLDVAYQNYSKEDLIISHAYLISKKV